MKKLSIFLLALVTGAGITQAAIVDGSCGDNLTWSLNTQDSTLTITGSGGMTNWMAPSSTPWYSYTSYIKYVSLPDGLTSIGNQAFYGCTGLTSVTIPNSVTSIGGSAFQNCSSLTSVTIPNSVTSIGRSAFSSCSGLTSVTIPNSVTSIGGSAFWNCISLTSVEIPNSVTSIGDQAFGWCRGLTSLSVEAGNTVYDSRNNCNAIIKTSTNTLISGCQNTTIPNSVTSIGDYAFSGCSGLTSVTIPNSVTSIGDCAFEACRGLTSVTIPNSVTSIGRSAFSGCSGLTSVTIPNSVTSIGNSAFSSCSGLTSITNYATTPQTIDSYVFLDVDKSTCILNVPNESVSLYQAAEGWKEFTNIVGVDEPSSAPAVYTNPANPAQKLIKNGNVYILTDDKTYSIDGRQVK